MARYVFDCDAWHFAHKLRTSERSLLQAALQHDECSPIVLTEYVQKHELCNYAETIDRYVRECTVVTERLSAQNHDFKRLRQQGVDKGEAEIIAWLLTLRKSDRLLLVLRDVRATAAARAEKLGCTDLLGLAIDMFKMGAITESEARTVLSVWDDKTQQLGRPRDWDEFDRTWARRQASGYPYGP